MAKTYKEFENEVRSGLSGSYNTSVSALKQNAATDKQTVNASADASIKTIKDNNAVQEADTREVYENKLQSNEVQRALNERYIARKAAEMGLTDSGLNRTQQTAVQLSYANQKGDLEQQMQKTIDTLAAAMQADINQVNLKRNADLAGIDTTLNTNLANLKSSFENDVITNTNERYSTYLENQQKRQEAAQVAKTTLLQQLKSDDYTQSQKIDLVNDYAALWGEEGTLSKDEWEHLLNDWGGLSVRLDVDKENIPVFKTSQEINAETYTDGYYRTCGPMKYYFVLEKSTNNWGGAKTVDNNDVVSIYYPDSITDGVPSDIKVATVRIDQLPQSIQQDITDRTAQQGQGHDFWYTCNFKGWDF